MKVIKNLKMCRIRILLFYEKNRLSFTFVVLKIIEFLVLVPKMGQWVFKG